MNNQIKQVSAVTSASFFDILQTPKDVLESIIKRQLAMELSNYIVEHINELPIVRQTKHEFTTYSHGVETYKIIVNLISDEELTRLKDIEYKYAKLMDKGDEIIRRRNEPVSSNIGWLNKPLTANDDSLIDTSSTLPGLNNLP